MLQTSPKCLLVRTGNVAPAVVDETNVKVIYSKKVVKISK